MKVEVQNIIDQLREELRKPLPGKISHQKMIPPDRPLIPPSENLDVNQSGVMLLLFPEDNKLKTVFIRRPSSMKNHAGQIAFPGGQFELTDKNLEETAIRETVEEIGIDAGQVEIIGQLSPLYVSISNFYIQAFIGWCKAIPSFTIDKREVAGLHVIPVDSLLHPGSLQNQKVDTIYGLTEFPGYMIDDVFIWGATAMILTEFIEVYNKI